MVAKAAILTGLKKAGIFAAKAAATGAVSAAGAGLVDTLFSPKRTNPNLQSLKKKQVEKVTGAAAVPGIFTTRQGLLEDAQVSRRSLLGG